MNRRTLLLMLYTGVFVLSAAAPASVHSQRTAQEAFLLDSGLFVAVASIYAVRLAQHHGPAGYFLPLGCTGLDANKLPKYLTPLVEQSPQSGYEIKLVQADRNRNL